MTPGDEVPRGLVLFSVTCCALNYAEWLLLKDEKEQMVADSQEVNSTEKGKRT